MRRVLMLCALAVLMPRAADANSTTLTLGHQVPKQEVFAAAKKYCEDHKEQCASAPTAEVVAMNSTRLWELAWVNAVVNISIELEAEEPGIDIWRDSRDVQKGDCDEFVLIKRRILIEKYHWPPSALLPTIVKVKKEHAEAHLVLVARTDEGDRVLDSYNSEESLPLLWHEMDYDRWIMQRSALDPRTWYWIVPPSRQTASAQ